MNRRNWFQLTGLTALSSAFTLPVNALSSPSKKKGTDFRFSLNTSTIMGNRAGIEKYIEIAAKAGYDGAEIWIMDLRAYLDSGKSLSSLNKKIQDSGITIENAIGFAPWMVSDDEERKKGYQQLEQEMNLLSEIGCKRVAAPPFGLKPESVPPFSALGTYYAEILDLGKKTGVMPQLEFWGASGTIFNLGQVMHIAAAANHPDVKLLPDIYHLFRGGSDFDGLKLLSGNAIDIFHFNDYKLNKLREEQTDSDRIYPGDGDAPMEKIIDILKNMGGVKVLSLELFNKDYWKQDELKVAKTGLEKMKKLIT
ncbi:MAG: sugar phosphate isomerase/epimerase [Cyclobacteriaceae bacterium]|nr:sugar phosphate isomerase/epimerase [Cyclobacteriaceae bacterium]